jgi:hypothetical protein
MAIAIPCAHLLKTVPAAHTNSFSPGSGNSKKPDRCWRSCLKARRFGVRVRNPIGFTALPKYTKPCISGEISRFALSVSIKTVAPCLLTQRRASAVLSARIFHAVPWLPGFSEGVWGDRAIRLSLCRGWLNRVSICRRGRRLEAQELRRSFWRRPFRRLGHAQPGHNFGWKSLRRPRSAFHGRRCRRASALFLGLHAAHGSLSSARHRRKQRCGFGLAGLLAGNMGLDLALTP